MNKNHNVQLGVAKECRVAKLFCEMRIFLGTVQHLLEPKNIIFTVKITILAILAHFKPTWQIGFSKMAINRIFLDLGPPKRYQW